MSALQDPVRSLGALAIAALVSTSCGGDRGEPRDDAEAARHGAHEEDEPEVVRLDATQRAAAGITVETARPGRIETQLVLPAVVAEDADATTHVNPLAPGVVRRIEKHLGERVERGELLCVVESVELGRVAADFVRARALVAAGERTLERGRELFAARLATVETTLDGAIEVEERIFEREEELQRQAVSTIRPLLEAEKALRAARLEKERALTELRAERDARLLALEIELEERRIGAQAAANALRALGIDPDALDERGKDAPLLAGSYEIRAARGGIITGRHITTGEFVDSQTKLYTLADLARVWVLASAFESDLRSVRTGQRAHVRLDAFPDQAFDGEVTLVGYEVDPQSRALSVRIELPNPELPDWPEGFPLRPGMFGGAELVIAEIEARVALPERAVVHGDGEDFVFVRTGEGRFERRRVELGAAAGELVEVREGIEPGDEVAVGGAFQLESVRRKGELGGGHGH